MKIYGIWITTAIVIAVSMWIRYGRLYYDKADLVILVLSSREHYNERQAIRDTWMKDADNTDSTEVVFAIGQPCLVHPNDRVDQYTCERWEVTDSDKKNMRGKTSWTVEALQNTVSELSKEFRFTVLHPILLTEIFVNSSIAGFNGKFPVVVTLYNRETEEDVLSINVTEDSQFTPVDDGLIIAVPGITLDKGFQGVFIIEADIEDRSVFSRTACSVFIHCDDVYRVTPLNFKYDILDEDQLIVHLVNSGSRNASWLKLQSRHAIELEKEMDTFEDIVYLDDVTDVYRNLPNKLLGGIQSISSMYDAQYLMKTDDDCYINITGIINLLGDVNNRNMSTPLWIGNFRSDWKVYDSGKWAEYKYKSVTYPPFACGSGYLLSGDIVQWLNQNSAHLQKYQGEDVSMGIWLSSINLTKLKTPQFSCDRIETIDMLESYSIPDLSYKKFNEIHENHSDVETSENVSVSVMYRIILAIVMWFFFIIGMLMWDAFLKDNDNGYFMAYIILSLESLLIFLYSLLLFSLIPNKTTLLLYELACYPTILGLPAYLFVIVGILLGIFGFDFDRK